MIRLLENLPVNHWVSYVLFLLTILAIVYSFKFFFSAEGRDERGRLVFARASMCTFFTVIVLFIYYWFHTGLFSVNDRATSFVILISLTLICSVQALGVFIFKRIGN